MVSNILYLNSKKGKNHPLSNHFLSFIPGMIGPMSLGAVTYRLTME
jgi:hypothetical protein